MDPKIEKVRQMIRDLCAASFDDATNCTSADDLRTICRRIYFTGKMGEREIDESRSSSSKKQ